MTLEDLRVRLVAAGFDPSVIRVATDRADFDERGYNVVPQGEGTFLIMRSDGRDGYGPVVESVETHRPRVFASESDVAEWLWTKITAPRVSTPVALTAEEFAENRRKIQERFDAQRRAAGLD